VFTLDALRMSSDGRARQPARSSRNMTINHLVRVVRAAGGIGCVGVFKA
jgi:hypothetical protein